MPRGCRWRSLNPAGPFSWPRGRWVCAVPLVCEPEEWEAPALSTCSPVSQTPALTELMQDATVAGCLA